MPYQTFSHRSALVKTAERGLHKPHKRSAPGNELDRADFRAEMIFSAAVFLAVILVGVFL